MPPNHPNSSRAKDVSLDVAIVTPPARPGTPSEKAHGPKDLFDAATETPHEASAAGLDRAADVLAAVADLVSIGTIETAEKTATTFTGLARKLEELEARLQQVGTTDGTVTVRRALGQIEAQLQEAVGTKASPTGSRAVAADVSASKTPKRSAEVHRRAPPNEAQSGTVPPDPIPADPGLSTEAPDCMGTAATLARNASVDLAVPSLALGAANRAAQASSMGTGEAADTTAERARELESSGVTGLAHHLPGASSEIEIDAAIRDLAIRMADIHQESLRRGASGFPETGGRRFRGIEPGIAGPAAGERLDPSDETGARAAYGSGTPTADAFSESRASWSGLLRRLEEKVDALARKADTEATAAADRHRTDLLARRIETTELQLTKRLDAGFATAAAEMRAVEEMVRALAAKGDAQGDLGGAIATLEPSLGTIRERLDRFAEQIAAWAPAPRAIEFGPELGETANSPGPRTEDRTAPFAPDPSQHPNTIGEDQRLAREITLLRITREETDRQVETALDAVQLAIVGLADRLARIETNLSNPGHGLAGEAPLRRASASVLPWHHATAKVSGNAAETGHSGGVGSRFLPDGDKAHPADPEPDFDMDILIEPGKGFTPPLELLDSRSAHKRSLDSDEGGSGRSDFIEAARRAVRAARGSPQVGLAAPPRAPAETGEGLLAKARRLARTLGGSFFPG